MLDSAKIRIIGDSAERKEKKARARKEKGVKKIKKHINFCTKKSEIKNAYFSYMPIILLVYKETF